MSCKLLMAPFVKVNPIECLGSSHPQNFAINETSPCRRCSCGWFHGDIYGHVFMFRRDVMPVTGESVNVVVVATVETFFQLVAKFPMFTEPSPVARSYPAVVVHASVAVCAGSTKHASSGQWRTLQFGVPPVHGTLIVPRPTPPVGKSLLPLVTSLKMQPRRFGNA